MALRERRTQDERRATTKRALLDSAAALFASDGYQGASLDEIAARAGYTRGALNYNFDGKQDLLLTLLDERLESRGKALSEATPSGLAGALPFDREFSLLFLEFAAVAARSEKVGSALLLHLEAGRKRNSEPARELLGRSRIDGSQAEDLVRLVGAFVNGLSIEALAGSDLNELNRRFELMLELLLAGLEAQATVDRERT